MANGRAGLELETQSPSSGGAYGGQGGAYGPVCRRRSPEPSGLAADSGGQRGGAVSSAMTGGRRARWATGAE